MKIIHIDQGFYREDGTFGVRHIPAIIDEDMYDEIGNYGWCIDGEGYARADVRRSRFADKRKTILMHRLVASPPPGFIVHHKNRNPLDNRRCNLMVLTMSEHLKLHWAEDRDRMMRSRWPKKTMTDAAKEQRKAAAKAPRKKREGSDGH